MNIDKFIDIGYLNNMTTTELELINNFLEIDVYRDDSHLECTYKGKLKIFSTKIT